MPKNHRIVSGPEALLVPLLWVLWKCLFLPLAFLRLTSKDGGVCQLLVQSEHVYVLSALCGSQAPWGTGPDTLLPVTWREVMLLIGGRFTYLSRSPYPKGQRAGKLKIRKYTLQVLGSTGTFSKKTPTVDSWVTPCDGQSEQSSHYVLLLGDFALVQGLKKNLLCFFLNSEKYGGKISAG